MHTSIHSEFTGNTRHSPRNGFTAYNALSLVSRAFLPPSLPQVALRKLDASVGASGPHDFAVRKQSALVRSATRVHRIPPRVRDDREPPLLSRRDGARNRVICDFGKSEYFFRRDWTGQISLICFNKFDLRSKPPGQDFTALQPSNIVDRRYCEGGMVLFLTFR